MAEILLKVALNTTTLTLDSGENYKLKEEICKKLLLKNFLKIIIIIIQVYCG
jgi:hypothetical protein